jgi:hypothetical protein
MKAKFMLGVLLLVVGAALRGGLAGDPEPICLPGKPCQAGERTLSGDPIPICLPEKPCLAGK